jgi:cell division protein FtsL
MNRLFLAIALFVAALAIGAVYESERRYDAAEDEALRIEQEIAATRREIHVLDVEWSYLTRPERLEELAALHLPLTPPDAGRMIASDAELRALLDELGGVTVANGVLRPGDGKVRP